jgi:biopolymer transport protein TolR
MGMSSAGGGGAAHGARRRRRTHVMSEINVTPMVDVMLVLLIIFMVSAPLLTVGVPIDLPQTSANPLNEEKEPLTITVNTKGEVYLQETPVQVEELAPRLIAITNSGYDERIYVRGDRNVNYGQVMKVMGTLSSAGFKRVALVTDLEQGS